jgi:hypothetical protein
MRDIAHDRCRLVASPEENEQPNDVWMVKNTKSVHLFDHPVCHCSRKDSSEQHLGLDDDSVQGKTFEKDYCESGRARRNRRHSEWFALIHSEAKVWAALGIR